MKNKAYKLILIYLILILLIIYSADSSTIENELYKIKFDSNTGFFNILFKKYNIYSFFNSSPLTSFVALKYDSTILYLDKIKSLEKKVEVKNKKIYYTYRTKFVEFNEIVSFYNVDDLNTGIKVEFKVKNLDYIGHFISIGVIIDTYLSEDQRVPFIVQKVGMIKTEQEYNLTDIPEMIYSLDDPENPETGVIFFLRKAGFTIPFKVLLANYERLKDNIFSYKPLYDSDFSSTYRKSDGAIGIIYKEKFIDSNATYSTSLLIGFYPLKTIEKNKTTEQGEVKKETDFIKVYSKEQIEKLNEQWENLNNKIQKSLLVIKNLNKIKEIEQKLKTIKEKIEYLIKNYNKLSDDEFKKLLEEINKLIQNLTEELEKIEKQNKTSSSKK